MIQAQGLSKIFGSINAVNNVSISVIKGEIHGLVGPDGAGKTTLIRLLCGVLTPTEGSVSRMGGSRKDTEKQKELLGYMPQRFSLYGDLTVMENICFFGRIYGLNKKEIQLRSDELLELTNLSAFKSRFAENLSGGMKQKLALTCALLSKPSLILLDEPTYGVDPESRKEFWKILYGLNGQGLTILVSTPYMDEADLCHRVSFMEQGKIIASDSPVRLKKGFSYKILEIPLGNKDLLCLADLPEILDAEVFGDRFHLRVADAAAATEAVKKYLHQQGIDDFIVQEVPPTMEDIFVALMDEEAD